MRHGETTASTAAEGTATTARLAATGLIMATLVAGAAFGGVLVVPVLAGPVPQQQDPVVVPTEQPTQPTPEPESTTTTPADSGRHPFAGWAAEFSPRVGVPVEALQAYAYAEWVLGQTKPDCKLSWTTLAGIGKVVTDHGRIDGAVLLPDGQLRPGFVGPPLDGIDGRPVVADTDAGALDQDPRWDRAVGPMGFLPAVWRAFAVDADADRLADPQDVDDAALAAGYQLCATAEDLSIAAKWTAAVRGYQGIGVDVNEVHAAAEQYGKNSRV